MGEEKKQLVLIGSEINTRDYITEAEVDGQNFNDIIEFLYKKYEEPIISYAQEQLGNIVARKDRIAIKFNYADVSGSVVMIEPSDQVQDIMQLNDTVNWTVETFGGAYVNFSSNIR
jgi:hypothetical protein